MSADWFIALAGVGAALAVFATARLSKIIIYVPLMALVVLSVAWSLNPGIALCVLSTAVILVVAPHHVPFMLVFLVSSLSSFATIADIATSMVNVAWWPVVVPALGVLALVAAVAPRAWRMIAAGAVLVLVLGSSAERLSVSVETAQGLVAIPVIATLVLTIDRYKYNVTLAYAVLGLVITINAAHWFVDPPRSPTTTAVLLPRELPSTEARFFAATESILRFVGIPVAQASSLDSIPQNALVLLPSLTSPLGSDEDWSNFVVTAEARRWIVVVGGEHSNLGGIRRRLKQALTGITLADDTTVPPGNRDAAGRLRSTTLIPFPHSGQLNRGASVELRSIRSRLLLSGDGWFAEPPGQYGAVTLLGDYRLDPGERRGRIPLVASINQNGARWMLVGDNSMMIDQQVAADPRALLWLLSAATLWPTFVSDIGILLVVIVTLGATALASENRRRIAAVAAVAVLFGAAGVGSAFMVEPSAAWKNTQIGEGPHDGSNFNAQLPRLIRELPGVAVVRHPGGIDASRLGQSNGLEIHFGLVNTKLRVSGIEIGGCRRVGSIDVQNVRLMNAQSCEIRGKADIIVGGKNSGTVVKIVGREGRKMFVILDTMFLSNSAPTRNLDWLIDAIKADASREKG